MRDPAYVSLRPTARWLVRLLLVELLLDLFIAGLVLCEVLYASGWAGTPEEGVAIEDVESKVQSFSTLTWLAECIIFFIWQYGFYENLPRLGVRDLRFSGGWAVAYWFIPILDLFRPYQVLQEMWKASIPESDPLAPGAWRTTAPAPAIRLYWALYLMEAVGGLALIAGFLAEALPTLTTDADFHASVGLNTGFLALHLVTLTQLFVLILVIERLTLRLDRKYESLRVGDSSPTCA